MGLFTKGLAFQAGMRATEKGDHKTALENFVKAGNLGHPDACYNAAVCYAQGKGTEKDLDKALAWAKLAKENKSREADKLIRQIQALQKQAAQPKNTTPKSDPKPAPKAKTDEELCNEGARAYAEKNYAAAVQIWRQLAEKGMARAQECLALLYYRGDGVEKDEKKSAEWYRKAAEQGYGSSCFNLAIFYERGIGVTKDLIEALRWAEKAKAVGAEKADNLIAEIRHNIEAEENRKNLTKPSVPKPGDDLSPEERYQKGMELFRAGDYDGTYALLRRVCRAIGANKNDYPDGQAAMGWMYEHGCGVEVAEDGMAHRHYEIAARNGDKDGMAGFVRLTAKMEMPGVSECQTALDYAKQLGTSEAKKAVSTLEQKLAEAKKYAELDLNEDNVKAIFNRCLATEDSKDLVGPILFSQKNGFPKDSEPVVFDKAQILKNEKNIDYLFGQLRDVRSSRHEFTLSSVAVNYHGELWTQDSGIILSFLHLGYANHLFNSFVRISSGDYAYVPFINLTLSPKDPNFPAWWEKHRAEWEALIQTEPQPHGK
ncbi:MAG: tetratricopeptide repeat protein [Hominenteromicrobium sp.]